MQPGKYGGVFLLAWEFSESIAENQCCGVLIFRKLIFGPESIGASSGKSEAPMRGGGLGSSTVFKKFNTPRRKWYLTTGRRAH